ncbi:MAG: hypothetical protein H0W67_04810 [Gemmatimonadales bacterium]|nr:hypothetical protein [Gemmatimonadales bacterium]
MSFLKIPAPRYPAWLAAFAIVAATATASAQTSNGPTIPRGQWPRPGLCRLWVDGIAPGRQPPVTDCATAERQAEYGIHLLYGGDNQRPQGYRDVGRRRTASTNSRPSNQGANQGGWGTYHPSGRDTVINDGGYSSNGGGYNGGSYRTDDGMCYDRNRDGRCDDATSAAPAPSPTRPGTNDGRAYDGYPNNRPAMEDALQFRDGIRSEDLTRWVGQNAVRVTISDANRDGRYETALFSGSDGKPVQSWSDANGDGEVELIRVYQGGNIVRTINR